MFPRFTELPPPDYLTPVVRAYADLGKRKVSTEKFTPPSPPSDTLIFDCETTADETQALRFGFYQWRERGEIKEQGCFYDPQGLSLPELELLRQYSIEHRFDLMTVDDFIEQIFYGYAYDLGATIIGFNLPFDISRLAKGHGSARGHLSGGFTLRLSNDKRRPNIQIKHINSKMALMRFVAPFRQRTPRGMRKRNLKSDFESGTFVDVRTLAAAQLSHSYSLASLSEHLEVPHRKARSEEHGGPLTESYLDYAWNDVQATWECFARLEQQYKSLGLDTPINRILSEASLGKAYLRAMNIKPWREVQNSFSPFMLGKIFSTYYGGRSEVNIRRKITRVMYCDFLSMYPTVCTKMGLWSFVTAQGMRWRNATSEIQTLLNEVSGDDLLHASFWMKLRTIVRLRPKLSLWPVRAEYTEGAAKSIGLNYLTCDHPLYFTLADCITAKFLTGFAPQIEEAIIFEPLAPQENLQSIEIGGRRIDPLKDDLYKAMIERRHRIKSEIGAATEKKKSELESQQLALKIVANATSYGIFVEVNVREARKRRLITCYGPGSPFKVLTKKIEEPGTYFHPLLATLVTGAARLLLALLQVRIKSAGLDWAFCDTDSMAIAKPDGMSEEIFQEKVLSVCGWFDALNPYATGGPLLKIEEENFALDVSGKLDELYSFAVSAKRYALFNLKAGVPVIRKASAHGLGHLLEPYTQANPSIGIPPPRVDLKDARLWHHDCWLQIVTAAKERRGTSVTLDWHEALKSPATSQYRASSPALLRWFNRYNADRDYPHQVKPFNFMLTASSPDSHIKPVAPYNSDRTKALKNGFDRNSGAVVSLSSMLTYRDAIARYHLHPENKFHNGDYCDEGFT